MTTEMHADSQVQGKLAAAPAPPQPELQHAAPALPARGWETVLAGSVEGVPPPLRPRRPAT